MKHARQVIREAVETQLAGIAGVTLTRTRAYKVVDLPAISIYIDTEQSQGENKDSINKSRTYSREANLVIEVVCEAVADFDNAVDDYTAQVEAAMGGDLTLGNKAVDSTLYATTVDVDGGSDKPLVVAKISYRVWYRTTALDPENNL